jgi:hypothetical protein
MKRCGTYYTKIRNIMELICPAVGMIMKSSEDIIYRIEIEMPLLMSTAENIDI